MSYLSDLMDEAEQSASVKAAHPDCTRKRDCPASKHVLECLRWRSERRRPAVTGGDDGNTGQ